MVTVLRRDLPPPTGNSELSKNERSVPWACGRGPGSLLFIDTRKDGLKPEFPRSSTALERAWVPRAKASILLNESTIGPLGTKGKNPLSTSVPRGIPLESKCDDRAGLLLCWALLARALARMYPLCLTGWTFRDIKPRLFLLTRASQSGALCFDTDRTCTVHGCYAREPVLDLRGRECCPGCPSLPRATCFGRRLTDW